MSFSEICTFVMISDYTCMLFSRISNKDVQNAKNAIDTWKERFWWKI